MKRIFGVFKRRWVVSLFGISALSLLIWYLGPQLAFAGSEPLASPSSRAVTIVVVFAFWLVNELRKWQLARRANAGMVEGLTSGPADPTQTMSEEEVTLLKERFDDALTVLKRARSDHAFGSSYLYKVPWYLLIGPPGSGKTTALLNSGLRFPVGKGEIQGVGGTRNCDWFFTDEAVLLDTAGRYVTQDSHKDVDRAAWIGFLGLLKRYRRRRPINGVLIAISVADLLQRDGGSRSRHAEVIKERLQELHKELGIRFPVYLLFTKCDLIAGFAEFFDNLDREGRAQVWGMTFPVGDGSEKESTIVKNFGPEFDELQARLTGRLLDRLQEERDPQRRDLIYGFPQQLDLTKDCLQEFIEAVFEPSRYQQRVQLRGIYFTSGTQEGTPLDHLLNLMATKFRLEPQRIPGFSGIGKSYFLTRLLREVVFQEAGLAGTDLRLERNRSWLQRGAYAGVLLVTGIVSAVWLTSFTRNRLYVHEVEKQVQVVKQEVERLSEVKPNLLEVLPLLDAARQIPGGYQDRDRGTPWLMGFGLSQWEKLGQRSATPAYRRLLSEEFLPSVLSRLKEQLRGALSGDLEFLYETLKVYLMVYDPGRFHMEGVKAWITLDWNSHFAPRASPEQREHVQTHLDALLAEKLPARLPVPQDVWLIERAREELLAVSMAQRVYSEVRREGMRKEIPPFRVSEAVGPDGPIVFSRTSGKSLTSGVAGLFTYDGYRRVLLGSIARVLAGQVKEGWVLGAAGGELADAVQRQGIAKEVRKIYLGEYVEAWRKLLDDIDIVHMQSLEQAVAALNVLSREDQSPLRRLLLAVERQTTLEREDGHVEKALRGGIGAFKDRLSRFFEEPGREEGADAEIVLGNLVDARFAELNRRVRTKDGTAAPVDEIISLLKDLYVEMRAIDSAADRGEAARKAALSQAGARDVIAKLDREAEQQPWPLSRWLRSIAEQSARLTVGGMLEHLNAVWSAEVLSFCQREVEGRYPLVRNSQQEISLINFGRFFGPGGLLEQFFEEYLTPFVDTNTQVWEWRSTGKITSGVSPETLLQFQRGAAIRTAFFPDGGKSPSVKFELRPISMDPRVDLFELNVGDQKTSYRFGPVVPVEMEWPSPKGTRQAQFRFSPPSLSGGYRMSENGPWAWFRLLNRIQVERSTEPQRFDVTFQVDERYAIYELRASSAVNPFNLKALEQFRCPARL